MQKVTHSYKNISGIMDYIDSLYYLFSNDDAEETHRLVSIQYPSQFEDIWELFSGFGYDFDCDFTDMTFPTVEVGNNSDIVVVCVSGGKDSFATALYYKEQGYDVKLFHLLGINKCYPDEHRAVEQGAKYLGLPLFEEFVKLTGSHQYVEHPLKNWILANAALSYAVNVWDTSAVAFGNFNTGYLIDNKFEVCGGDTVDLWNMYNKIIQTVIPDFEVLLPISDISESLKVVGQDRKLLEISQSCIGTYRFREYKGNLVRKKYGVDLLPHRCGSCWKCAVEYLYYVEHGIFDMNEPYYKHCLKILYNTMKVDNNYNDYTVQEVWDNYMLADSIKDAKLDGIETLNMKGKM